MKIKRKINGDSWFIKVVTQKEMKRQREDGDHLAGLCVPDEKTIYVLDDCVEYPVIVHELFHAFVSYLHLDDTNTIPLDDLEEIYAKFFEQRAETIIRKAKRITKDLKRMKEEQE